MNGLVGFAPDVDPTTPGVITDCTNIIPTLRGYIGGPVGTDVGMDALASAALSAAVLAKLDGTNRTFAGTATKLYEKSGASWLDRSRATPDYNATTINPWRFAQFGNTSLAVNKGDQLQSSSSGAFANLNAPTAKVICTWKGFVVLGNTNDGGAGTSYGDSPARWWTSAYLDHTSWTPSIATQSTTGELVETPGAITGLKTLGEYVIAYKDNSIYVGRDAGSPTVIAWNVLPGTIGCSSHEAIADIGTAHIFVGPKDIYMFDGNTITPIGTPLREWFFADLDPLYKSRIRSNHDKTNSLVYFHYPRLGSNGNLNGCIVYNYNNNKWGVSHRSIECAIEYITGGYTYDTLPFSTYDTWPSISYDDPFWDASSEYVSYFGTDHKIYSWTGMSNSSSMTLGYYGIENIYTLLSRVTVKFLTSPTTYTMTNYYCDVLGDAWTEDQTTTGSNGRFDVLMSAPYHKVKFDFTGDYEITAASADTQKDGEL